MLSTYDVIAFIPGGNEHGIEVDRPDSVVGFLKPDVLIDERFGDIQKLATSFSWHTGNLIRFGFAREE